MCEVREDIAKTDNEILSRIAAGGMGEVWKQRILGSCCSDSAFRLA
jgi:hypothetical protein